MLPLSEELKAINASEGTCGRVNFHKNVLEKMTAGQSLEIKIKQLQIFAEWRFLYYIWE
jgi:hypothetical protein